MNDSVIMHFDPLSSPERKPLSNPSLPLDKENLAPANLSMSVYFNRPYGMFSNPASPEKKPSSPKKKGALIELSFDNSSNDEDDIGFEGDGEDETIKLGPILAGLDISKTPDLRRIPFGDVGQTDPIFDPPVIKFKPLLAETSGTRITPQRSSQHSLQSSPAVLATSTPPTAFRVAAFNPTLTPQTPPTIRPARILTSDSITSYRTAFKANSLPSIGSVSEYPPLPPSPIDEGVSLTLEPPLEGSGDEEQDNFGESRLSDVGPTAALEEAVVTPSPEPELTIPSTLHVSTTPSHLSPPGEQAGTKNRLSLDLDAAFELRNVRLQDVSFDILEGDMPFMGRNPEGDNLIYATNQVPNVFATRPLRRAPKAGTSGLPFLHEDDEPVNRVEDAEPLELLIRADSRLSRAASVRSPTEIHLPESRPSSVASTIPTDDEIYHHRPPSALRSTSSLGLRPRSSLSTARSGAPESNLGLARRTTMRTEATGKLKPIRSTDTTTESSANAGTRKDTVRPRSQLLAGISRPPSRGTDVDAASADRLAPRTVQHGRASSVGTLRGVPSLAGLPNKAVPQANKLSKPTHTRSQTVSSTRVEQPIPPVAGTAASRRAPRPSSVSTLPAGSGGLTRPSTSLGVTRKAAPAPVATTSTISRPRPSIASGRPSIAPTANKPRASTVMATPRPVQSNTVPTTSRLPSTRPASRIGIPQTRPAPGTRRAV